MNDGHTTRAPGNGARRARVDGQGRNKLGAGSRVPPTWREKRGSGEGAGRGDGGKVCVRGRGETDRGGRATVRTRGVMGTTSRAGCECEVD
jgi:hypothetical protein